MLLGRDQHCIEQGIVIHSSYALGQGVGDDGHGIVAYHAVRLPAVQLPDRELSAFVVDGLERTKEIRRTLTLDQAEKRVQGTESIPYGEYCITVITICYMRLSIHSAVFAVYVGIEGGMNGCMV